MRWRYSHSQSLNLFTACIITPSLTPIRSCLSPFSVYQLLGSFIHPCFVILLFLCKNTPSFPPLKLSRIQPCNVLISLLPLPPSDFPFVPSNSFPFTLCNFSFPTPLYPLSASYCIFPFPSLPPLLPLYESSYIHPYP